MGINHCFEQQPIYPNLQEYIKKIHTDAQNMISMWSFDNRDFLLPIYYYTSSTVNGSILITLHITNDPSIPTLFSFLLLSPV